MKHKYIKRTGGSGNYKYFYRDEKTGKLYSQKKPDKQAFSVGDKVARFSHARRKDEHFYITGWHERTKRFELSRFPKQEKEGTVWTYAKPEALTKVRISKAEKNIGDTTVKKVGDMKYETKIGKYKITWDKHTYLDNYGYDSGKPELTVMSPSEFLNKATSLPEDMQSRKSIDYWKEQYSKGGSKEEVSFSIFLEKEKGVFTGEHEGRHRALAAKELGIEKIPVLVLDRDKRGTDRYTNTRTGKGWEDLEDWKEKPEKKATYIRVGEGITKKKEPKEKKPLTNLFGDALTLAGIGTLLAGIFAIGKFRKLINKYVNERYEKGLEEVEKQLSFNADYSKTVGNRRLLEDYVFENIKDMTEEMGGKLRQTLQRGLMNGESKKELRTRVAKVFKGDNPTRFKFEYRIKMIVRTEGNRAFNMARYQAALDSGLTLFKYVKIIKDDRTSNICWAENAKYGSPDKAIPLREKFRVMVGKKVYTEQFPPLHPNCMTVGIYIQEEDIKGGKKDDT